MRVTVTGNLWDHMGRPIPADKRPELHFRPSRSNVSGSALLAGVEAQATLDVTTGAFTVDLEADAGIEYTMLARWVMNERDAPEHWAYQYTEWPQKLHPYPGGGTIDELMPYGRGTPLTVLVSLNDPPADYRGLWLHAAPGDPVDVNQSGTGELRRVTGEHEYIALANLKGEQGDVTPAALDALADAREARDDAQTARTGAEAARDTAETFAVQTVELQDTAVAGLIGDESSASRARVQEATGADMRVPGAPPNLSAVDVAQQVRFGAVEKVAPFGAFRQAALKPSWLTNVVVVGDSMAAPNDAPYISGIARLAYRSGAASFPHVDDVTAAPTTGVNWFQGGVSGSLTSNFLPEARLQKIATIAPHAIVMLVGNNDFRDQVPIATFKSNLRSAMQRMLSDTAHAQLLVVHSNVRRDLDLSTRPITWEQYGQAMAEVAAEHQRASFVPLHDYLKLYNVQASSRWGLVNPGQIHPSHQGHKLIADMLGAILGIPADDVIGETLWDFTSSAVSGTYNIPGSGDPWRRILFREMPERNYPRLVRVEAYCASRVAVSAENNVEFRIRDIQTGQWRGASIPRDNNVFHGVHISHEFYVPPRKSAQFEGLLYWSGTASMALDGNASRTFGNVVERPY